LQNIFNTDKNARLVTNGRETENDGDCFVASEKSNRKELK